MYFIQWKKALQKMLERENIPAPAEADLQEFFDSGMSPSEALRELSEILLLNQ